MPVSIAIDCRDVEGQASFWARALGYRRSPVAPIAMTDPEGNEFCVEQIVDPDFRVPD